jgi:hypothetical protein
MNWERKNEKNEFTREERKKEWKKNEVNWVRERM